MQTSKPVRSGLAVIAAATVLALAAHADDKVLAIKGGTAHLGDGRTIEHATIIMRDGRIAAVGVDAPIPEGAPIIDAAGGSVTPGLIDANAQLESADVFRQVRRGGPAPLSASRAQPSPLALFLQHQHEDAESCVCSGQVHCALEASHESLKDGQTCPCCGYPAMMDPAAMASGVIPGVSETESYSEVVPHTLVLDSLNLRSPDFDRLLRAGVTTVFVAPDSAAVIGPRGCIVRTGGPIADRIVRRADAVQGTLGEDSYRVGLNNMTPSSNMVTVRTRRPMTRMGVTWVFRRAFYDAERWNQGIEVTGADASPAEALPILDQIRRGEFPLRIQARKHHDILAALRFASELNLKFTLVEATEAYKCIPELKFAGGGAVPIIFGPIYMDPSGVRARSRETDESRLSTVVALTEAGLLLAISAQDLREEDGLGRQAMYAVRAGLSPDKALEAVTLAPARLLGIADQMGSIEVGKRADLVVWSGEGGPIAATSRPEVVLIGGRVVLDSRERAAR
jgi:imidazolonepropionase-like amidohydrolase